MDKLDDGFKTVAGVVDERDCNDLTRALPSAVHSGTRTLLANPIFAALVASVRQHRWVGALLADRVAIQCTYYCKTQHRNWSLRLHRDRYLPINGRGHWTVAGIKEGLRFIGPPRSFLERCLAVRLALDAVPEGDLSVIPGSQATDFAGPKNVSVVKVPRGGVLAFVPTLLHGSRRLHHSPSRRLLHFVFGPVELPSEYRWYFAV